MAIKRNCDICQAEGNEVPAVVDTKTKRGYWAYLCEAHNNQIGCGIPALTNVLSEVNE